MDLRETNPYLRSMAHFPLQAAFRYHRQATESPHLALEWVRFPDSSVLAAVIERAIVTTLVTVEGKSLTEVRLSVKNQAQPFLRIALPAGSNILSAEVAGEKVKPVQGADGSRVPLLRPGFRPAGAYEVSFVFMHSGAPFADKGKGGSQLTLPQMDVPITLLQWEVFLPERYKVAHFGGSAIAASLMPAISRDMLEPVAADVTSLSGSLGSLYPGQLGGTVVDPSGAVIANSEVTITHADTGAQIKTRTDSTGKWLVSNQRSGAIAVTASSPGFRSTKLQLQYDASQPAAYNMTLPVGTVAETVEVTAGNTPIADYSLNIPSPYSKRKTQSAQDSTLNSNASLNVFNLQRRVAGVLPVTVDVPRAGNSYHFVRALVLDEETKVTFAYKTK